ncbi:MAG: bifunctional folylpolyglutamate synthase/dihydrofolate synthase [Acidobacteria bacterium]|nr:MAG: bifunctional folylpolyglutamate synthase/dihydrofolate synthase [Acidobacteriota bacterium]
MRYSECLHYLNRLGHEIPAAKSGLDNIRTILQALGDPQHSYPSILIAGTNGKGSVAAFLSAILTACGLRTGLYTSPHLISADERIALDGQSITPEAFADCISRTAELIQKLDFPCHPTFFETMTAAAFLYFAETKVDLAVVEAGMGGRTDSTNILEPVLSVITPISIDHQQYLGETLEEIAYQKAGIIHPQGMVISSKQRPEVQFVLEQEAKKQEALLWYADDNAAAITDSADGRFSFTFRGSTFAPMLYGRHQVLNAVLAISTANQLKEVGYPIPIAAFSEGVNRASIPGRLQKICDSPAVFLDGAHNDEALTKLAEFVCVHTRKPRSLVFATMGDKRFSSLLDRLAQCFDTIYLTHPSSARAAQPDQLMAIFPNGIWVEKPVEALKLAKQNAETVVVTGSLYLVGEILASYCGRTLQSPVPGSPRARPKSTSYRDH